MSHRIDASQLLFLPRMSNIKPQGSQFDRNIRLSRLEQTLAQSGAQRCGVEPREWVRQALLHYDRWQELWEGPTTSPDDHTSEVELFANLVENSPECLRGQWQHLHDIVRLNKALWVWPTQSVDEFESGFEPTLPYLDRAALAKAWPRLRSAVSDMMLRVSVMANE